MMSVNLSRSTLQPVIRRSLSTSLPCLGSDKSVPAAVKLQEPLPLSNEEKATILRNSTISVVPEEISVTSGIPEEHVTGRRVRIYQAVKNAMQSGTFNTKNWLIEFETRERWENNLMGWTSTGDPLSNLVLKFPDRESAVLFCERNGWIYEAEDPHPEKKARKKTYAENFSWNKRCRLGSK